MKAIGTENAWFSFKGIRNDALNLDVRMLAPPTRPHPARKGNLTDVPGKDGKLFQDEKAYDCILVTVPCATTDNSNIDAISAWLSGEGDLIFGDEPTRAYHARITKEFSRSNRAPRLRGQAFTPSFDCEPYRYSAVPSTDADVYDSGDTIINPGTIASAPQLQVMGNGNGNLMIGSNTLIFTDLSGSIVVDCEAKIAYTGGSSANDPMVLATQKVTGEWPMIQPGTSYITFTGGITSVVILPRWRWL